MSVSLSSVPVPAAKRSVYADTSFAPPEQTRRLRDLTRYRVKLSEELNRIHNRIHKALEDASIKLDTVVSHILGGTGGSVIEGIIEGKGAPRQLAERAQGSLRGKRAQLELVASWAGLCPATKKAAASG